MISALCLVKIHIVLQELRSIGRSHFRIATGMGISPVSIVLGTLRVQPPLHLVTGIGTVILIKIAFSCHTGHVIHRHSHCRLDTGVNGSSIDRKPSESADTEYADTFRINIFACGKIIHSCAEIFSVDVRR